MVASGLMGAVALWLWVDGLRHENKALRGDLDLCRAQSKSLREDAKSDQRIQNLSVDELRDVPARWLRGAQ